MPNGAYTEPLPIGTGDLKVTDSDWSIQFYFPGPDLRHNGTFVSISSHEVDAYIKAYQANWREYRNLVQLAPPGTELVKPGELGMTIRVGGFRQGVCLAYYHFPIDTEKELEDIVHSLDWAMHRAQRVQEAIRRM